MKKKWTEPSECEMLDFLESLFEDLFDLLDIRHLSRTSKPGMLMRNKMIKRYAESFRRAYPEAFLNFMTEKFFKNVSDYPDYFTIWQHGYSEGLKKNSG